MGKQTEHHSSYHTHAHAFIYMRPHTCTCVHTCVHTPLACHTQEYVSVYLPRFVCLFVLTNTEPGDTLKKKTHFATKDADVLTATAF